MPDNEKPPGTLAVVILTYNEEANITQALDSVAGWANELFILDSLSTDRTLDIARPYGCHIAQNKFEDYAKQRNHALDHLPITSEWVLFLDADEWLPVGIKQEISALIAASPKENGFFVNWRLIWMGARRPAHRLGHRELHPQRRGQSDGGARPYARPASASSTKRRGRWCSAPRPFPNPRRAWRDHHHPGADRLRRAAVTARSSRAYCFRIVSVWSTHFQSSPCRTQAELSAQVMSIFSPLRLPV